MFEFEEYMKVMAISGMEGENGINYGIQMVVRLMRANMDR